MSKQLDMLTKCIEVVSRNHAMENDEAYEILLHFAAYKLSVDEGIVSPTLKMTTWAELNDTLNFDVLREKTWDWFGELYVSLGLQKGVGFVAREDMARQIAQHYRSNKGAVDTFLDPVCGSGRLMLTLFMTYGNHILYYGCDPDLTAYRTAIVNMKLYKVNAKVLYANKDKHNIDITSPNWQYANKWLPPRQDRYYNFTAAK